MPLGHMRPLLLFCILHLMAAGPCEGDIPYEEFRRQISQQYRMAVPQEWGERVAGVKTRLATQEKVIALTFDACGSSRGMRIDNRLVEFLEQEQIPATLFVNARWVDSNRAFFERLAVNPLFEIANHGYRHKPASVNGKSAYGIEGTRSVEDIVDEIELNNQKLLQITGYKPRFYRSGTAYYDEVAVRIAADLGQQIAGYSVLGDAGATYSSEKVRRALLNARPGDIVLLHMNHPHSGTAAGVMDAVPELKQQGYRFVRLSDYPLR